MGGAVRSRVVFGASLGLVFLTVSAIADPLGAVEPGKQEQHGIYVLNRARSDPAKYGRQIGVDLSTVAPQPPLAVNTNLTGSARFHSQEMVDNDYFAHTSPVTGDGPNTMVVQNGYDLFGGGLGADYGTLNTLESIAFGVNSIPTFSDALALLIEDKGVPGLGHRVHLLAMVGQYQRHREVGMGRATGTDAGTGRPKRLYTIHSANVNTSDLFITGVVYSDANKNGKYDAGEGLGGVTVATDGRQTTSLSQGGYSLPVTPDTYTVTCSDGGFVGTGSATVEVTDANIEVDFRSGVGGAQINFVDLVPPPFPGPDMNVSAAPLQGVAPLETSFNGTSGDPAATFAWDFGDGGEGAGPAPSHEFALPGLFTTIGSATNADGTNRALTVVAVGDPAATSVAPAASGLTMKKLATKSNFKKVGKDKIVAAFSMELPAGFLPGDHVVTVNIGGVGVDIPISAKNKGVDAGGNKIALKAPGKALKKAGKSGVPIEAGIVAKVKVSMKGDFSETLGIAGLRNTTEVRTLEGFPVAVLIDGHAYRTGVALAEVSKEAKKSVGKLVK